MSGPGDQPPPPEPEETTGQSIGKYLHRFAALLDANADVMPALLTALREMDTDAYVAAMGPSRGDVIAAYLEASRAHARLRAALDELAEYMEGRNAATLRRSNTN